MTPANYIRAQLAEHCFMEAGHMGGLKPMLAIAFIVRNRVRAGWYGGDWMQTIENHWQASSREPYERPRPSLRSPDFQQLLSRIDDIHTGMEPDEMTAEGLYYCELHLVDRVWFRDNILRKGEEHPRIANVGQMVISA